MGKDKLGVWDSQIHTTIHKINGKDLLYSTGNYIQYLVKNCDGKEKKEGDFLLVCSINIILHILSVSFFPHEAGVQYFTWPKSCHFGTSRKIRKSLFQRLPFS